MSVKRKGRTLVYTIDELLESKRMDIAMKLYETDKSFLKAILIELGAECMSVAKNTCIKRMAHSTKYGLVDFEVIPHLKSLDPTDFNTFNIWWNLSPEETELYLAQINGASKEELIEIRQKALAKFGLSPE